MISIKQNCCCNLNTLLKYIKNNNSKWEKIMILSSFSYLIYAYFLKDDLSKDKVATQEHTYLNQKGANYSVDRNYGTCMRTNPIGVTSLAKSVWWKVDLGEMYNIYAINVLFKDYDSYGMCISSCQT